MRAFYITVTIKGQSNIPIVKDVIGHFPNAESAAQETIEWIAASNLVKWDHMPISKRIASLQAFVEETK